MSALMQETGGVQSIQELALETKHLTRLTDLIKKALAGELPRDRQPRHEEPKVLTPLHINIVLDRAAGYQLTEIAERWEYTPVQVANVLKSPDAQYLLSTIQGLQANTLVSMEERFRVLAPEALNAKVELMRDPATPAGVRDRVATDILDRAGYAPRKQEEITHKHQVLLPAQVATGLRDVLEESKRVASVDYQRFLQKSGGEVAAEHFQVAAEPENSASPVLPAASGEAPPTFKVA